MTKLNNIVVNRLIELSQDSNHATKIASITALGEAGSPEAVDRLIDLSASDNHATKIAAIAALGRAGRLG